MSESTDAEGRLAYFRDNPEIVTAKADKMEDHGFKSAAGYTRYHLALAQGEQPDPIDAEAAGLPMPEELTPEPKGSS